APLGRFDAVFDVGLLYHLPDPHLFLKRLAAVADRHYLWTHFCPPAKADAEQAGYRGCRYREFGVAEPLSGLSPTSFWPTLPELQRMLADVGWTEQTVVARDNSHPHGPTVTLAVERPA
ncbi:MAG: hypothetical protein ACRDD1_00715, partial [Planctomycetia bacterium]